MTSNQLTYTDRLAALRRALATALSDAQHTLAAGHYATPEEGAELCYVNLWDATRHALVKHADCDLSELLDIIANDLHVVPSVPIVGTVEHGRVIWNSDGLTGA